MPGKSSGGGCTMPGRTLVSSNREAVIAESWQRTLSGYPDLYRPPGLSCILAECKYRKLRAFRSGAANRRRRGRPDARRSHMSIFQEWLCFGLERQKEELEEYFSGLEGDRREIVANWLTLEPYEQLGSRRIARRRKEALLRRSGGRSRTGQDRIRRRFSGSRLIATPITWPITSISPGNAKFRMGASEAGSEIRLMVPSLTLHQRQ